MIIKDLSKSNNMKFESLNKGDVFRYEGNLFFKVDSSKLPYNVYNLTRNEIDTLSSWDSVEYITSELILHSPDWEEE